MPTKKLHYNSGPCNPMAKIPIEDYSLIVTLRQEYDLTYREIAEKWEVNESTISRLIRRATAHLPPGTRS